MTSFWLGAGALILIALAFLLIPLWRERRRSGHKTLSGQLVAIAVIPISLGLYLNVTTFDPEIADSPDPNGTALLDQLAARLASDPTDVDGWVLLGRSYFQLGDYGRARLALQEAWDRTAEPDDLLKLAYAQALLFTEEGAALTQAGDLVEEVLETSPQSEGALLWGGFVAVERNQPVIAADRWNALLASNPPPDITELVLNQLLLLAGGGDDTAPPTAATAGPILEIDVSVTEAIALDRFGPNARLFIIARATDSPAPIAATQHPLASLPGRFSLSDADAMIPGRSLSQYDSVTVIARISGSGQPTEQPGDAYAEASADPDSVEILSLVIDTIVP